MKDKILYLFGGIILMGIFWILSKTVFDNSKIVVVDSQHVLEEYSGFKEAKDAYELKVKKLSENFDSQRRIYESKGKEFEILEKNLSNDEKLKTQANLMKMKEELLRAGSVLENQSSIEEEKLLKAVLNKINDFIERYGKHKGYGVILGANGQGNILYTEDKIDITAEVIQELNNEYVEGNKY
jgi:outer membrane protein